MRNKQIVINAIIVETILCLLLTSCFFVSPSIGNKIKDRRAPVGETVDAKKFKPIKDKALLYIFRPNDVFGDEDAEIQVDGKIENRLIAFTFIIVQVDNGIHHISSKIRESKSSLDVQTVQNNIYYIMQKYESRRKPPRLTLIIDEEKAQYKMWICALLRPLE